MDDSTRRQLRHLLVRLVDRLEHQEDDQGTIVFGPVEAHAWSQELRDAASWCDDRPLPPDLI